MNPTEIIEKLTRRRSCKVFDTDKKVSDDDLQTILESARMAPSSFGLQPWKIKVVHDQETKDKLFAISSQQQIKTCSHLLVLCGNDDIDSDYIADFVKRTANGVDQEAQTKYIWSLNAKMWGMTDNQTLITYINNQVYIALGVIITASAMMKIDAAPMGGFNASEFDRILWLSDAWLHSVTLCALGYRSEEDERSKKPKFRYEMDELML